MIGFAILAVAAIAGYFILPNLLSGGSSGGGTQELDKAADKAADKLDEAADVAAGVAGEAVDELADLPLWAWALPGFAFAYAAGVETHEEIGEYLGGTGYED
jgi:hypothetical protein